MFRSRVLSRIVAETISRSQSNEESTSMGERLPTLSALFDYALAAHDNNFEKALEIIRDIIPSEFMQDVLRDGRRIAHPFVILPISLFEVCCRMNWNGDEMCVTGQQYHALLSPPVFPPPSRFIVVDSSGVYHHPDHLVMDRTDLFRDRMNGS